LGNSLPLAIFSLPTRSRQHLSTSYAQLFVRFGFFVDILKLGFSAKILVGRLEIATVTTRR
jgi:hypothetical protein